MRDNLCYQIIAGSLAAAMWGVAGTMTTSEAKAAAAALIAGIVVGTIARSWRSIVIPPLGIAAGSGLSIVLGSVGPAWSNACLPVTVGLALLGAASVAAVRHRLAASHATGSHSPEYGT
ncbi:MAG TPA: hypothetical protein VFI42_05635 [Thermomicrobiaceae bacterium]|nr:hypothetical protein [Thermomicrobiaceae bacterium]